MEFDFATDTTADDDRRRREEEEAEQQRALAQRRRSSAAKPVDDLPAGWTKHVDKRTGATFYRDEAAGESTWTKPTRPARGAAPAPQEGGPRRASCTKRLRRLGRRRAPPHDVEADQRRRGRPGPVEPPARAQAPGVAPEAVSSETPARRGPRLA